MKALTYAEARGRFRPGDALLTAEPGPAASTIRILTGDEWSHAASPVTGWPDDQGRLRSYVTQANAGKGIHLVLTSEWLVARRGRVCYFQTPLTHKQRDRWNAAVGDWIGRDYEGARDFLLQGLGLDTEQDGEDRDKVCSAYYAALWQIATGREIPGRPWLRWLPAKRGHRYVPTPGAIYRFLVGLGCTPHEVLR